MSAKAIFYLAMGGLSVVASAIATALGGWDASLKVLCIIMAVDYITGIACALIWKKSPKSENGAFESKASIKGLFRKGAMLAIVWIAYNLDLMVGTTFLRDAVIFFFIGNDGLSIVENLGIIGLPLPDVIKNAFEVLKKKGEQPENKE